LIFYPSVRPFKKKKSSYSLIFFQLLSTEILDVTCPKP
jgi:hypothetical protein